MVDTAGTPRTRALAAALRAEIEGSRMGVRELARVLDRSHTTVSQWQNGHRVPSPDDVAAVLAILRVTGRRRDEIINLSRNAGEANWLAVGQVGVAEQVAGLVECERTALEIVTWSPLLIPGPLRSADYASAIHGQDGAPATVRRPGPSNHVVLLGDGALRHEIGGASVMVEQLRLLVDGPARTAIHVVPFGETFHAGLLGPFTLFTFTKSLAVVHLEHSCAGAFLCEARDVAEYQASVATLRESAHGVAESRALLAERIKELER